jgi:polygalacturonase
MKRLIIIAILSYTIILGCKSKIDPVEEIINRIKLPIIPEKDYNVASYQNIIEEGNDIKGALDRAIKECADKGGGRVVIPKGDFYCNGPIHLKSNVNLHISEGATLTFSSNEEDYLPLVLVRWEGVECYNYSPYIYANGQKNIAVTGKGEFIGEAKKGFFKWRKKQKPSQKKLREMGRNQTPLEDRVFGKGQYLRPAFCQFMNSENILISDFTVKDFPFWIIQPTYCKSVIVRNLVIDSYNLNNDGVDPDSSEDVLIENCWFNTGDDAIAIKSGRDNDGWRVGKPSKNIVIRDCFVKSALHGIAIGSEMSGGIDNVFIYNFEIENIDDYAIQLKSNLDRGSYMKNINIENIDIDKAGTAIYFTNDYHSYSGGNYPTEFSYIKIKDITCKKTTGKAIDIVGLKQKPIHNILLKDISINEEGRKSTIQNVVLSNFKNLTIAQKQFTSQLSLK